MPFKWLNSHNLHYAGHCNQVYKYNNYILMSILSQFEQEMEIYFLKRTNYFFYCLSLWSIKIIIVIKMQNKIYKNQ